MGLGSGIRDPGSGKNLFRIPDPGVQKAPDPGSWIPDPGSGSATLVNPNFLGNHGIGAAVPYEATSCCSLS